MADINIANICVEAINSLYRLDRSPGICVSSVLAERLELRFL